jgi:hypothetical protein
LQLLRRELGRHHHGLSAPVGAGLDGFGLRLGLRVAGRTRGGCRGISDHSSASTWLRRLLWAGARSGRTISRPCAARAAPDAQGLGRGGANKGRSGSG